VQLFGHSEALDELMAALKFLQCELDRVLLDRQFGICIEKNNLNNLIDVNIKQLTHNPQHLESLRCLFAS